MGVSPLEALYGVLAFVAISVIGILGRVIFAGFRDTVVRAVLDSSLKKLLGNIDERLSSLMADMLSVRGSQEREEQAQLLSRSEIAALRGRVDTQMDSFNTEKVAAIDFHAKVTAFMDWAVPLLHRLENLGRDSVDKP